MIFFKRIQAGSLQLVLFVGAIIAILLFSFVLLTYTHSLFLKKTDLSVELIQAADDALITAFNQNLQPGEVKTRVHPVNPTIETEVRKSYWGIFPLYEATAKKRALQFKKLAFTGQSRKSREALYLKDNLRPLVLAGSSKISGTAFLPERGVKAGNIAGNGYLNAQLIYGDQRLSGPDLPQIAEEQQQQWQQLYLAFNGTKAQRTILKKGTQLTQSFKDQIVHIEGDFLDLEGVRLTGNILVRATKKIVVRASSTLRDVVLIAPEINIEPMTTGVFQAFATKIINVGKQVKLDYPSVLGVNAQNNFRSTPEDQPSTIYIGENAQIRGIVIFSAKEDDSNPYQASIKVDTRSVVVGEVYSTHSIELKGSVYGSVITSGFLAAENGNLYQNHIYNGIISGELLPEEYTGLNFESTRENAIAKWVY